MGGPFHPSLAGEGHEHLVGAVGAADAGEALMQIAALEEGRYAVFDDGAPEAVLGRKPLVVDLLEGLEMLVQQPPQVGGMGVTGPVQRQRLDTRGGHDRQGTGPGLVYATPLDQMCTSCQEGRPSPAGNRSLDNSPLAANSAGSSRSSGRGYGFAEAMA